jgi:hypothetical protein
MVNQSQEPPTDAEIDGESNDPGLADPPRPGLILLAADDTVVCIDDACLPGDVQA